jgi:hypothetical protein
MATLEKLQANQRSEHAELRADKLLEAGEIVSPAIACSRTRHRRRAQSPTVLPKLSSSLTFHFFSNRAQLANDLFAAKRILQATDGALHFAYCFVGLAFGLEFGIACQFANCFLHGALGLLGRTLNAILIHLVASQV